MDKFREQPTFEIHPVVEQRPFEDPAVRSFFARWFRINDDIQSHIISREEWNQRDSSSILEKLPDGKQILYIPSDLQLWEMIGIVETIDSNTFTDNPVKRVEAKEKLVGLGKTFQNAGIYIAQRLEFIGGGQEIAGASAAEFYGYGKFLTEEGEPTELESIDDIASRSLTPIEIEAVDRFLAGDHLYQKRKARAEKTFKKGLGQAVEVDSTKRDRIYEAERRRILAQFFRASKKAFELEGKSASGELQESVAEFDPWQSDASIHSAFLAKIEKSIVQTIETPKREFVTAIFRRGMELLQRNISFETLPESVRNSFLHWQNGEKTLFKALQIEKLRAELETVRKSGSPSEISAKEREIVNKIQSVVSSLPYRLGAMNPKNILTNQCVNCLGATILGGTLMEKAGLNYLVGEVPLHTTLFLVTTDGHVEWRDMLTMSFNEDLDDEKIEGHLQNGSTLKVADIVAFSKRPTPEGLMFDIKSEAYRQRLGWVKEGERQYVVVFGPEYGQQILLLEATGHMFLNSGLYEEAFEAYSLASSLNPKVMTIYHNLGYTLGSQGRHEEAIEAYRQAITVNLDYANPYKNLGNSLLLTGRYREAVKAYQKALEAKNVDPTDYTPPYNNLGNALQHLGLYEVAVEAYRQAITVKPKHAMPYNNLGTAFFRLGRYEEATAAYQKFLDLADMKKDAHKIKEVKAVISRLKF